MASSSSSSSSVKSYGPYKSIGEAILASSPDKKIEPLSEYLSDLATTNKVIVHGGAILSGGNGALGCAGIGAFGGPIGMGIGAGVGFVGGVICHYWALNECRPRFTRVKEWEARTPVDERRIARESFVKAIEDPGLLDPVTLNPLTDPVRTPEGIVYNRHELAETLKGTKGICPLSGRPLTMEDTVTDYATLGKMAEASSKIAKKQEGSESQRTFYAAMAEDLQRESTEFFKQADAQLRKLLDENKITARKYKSEHDDVFAKLHPTN